MHQLLERNTDHQLNPTESSELETLVQLAQLSQIVSMGSKLINSKAAPANFLRFGYAPDQGSNMWTSLTSRLLTFSAIVAICLPAPLARATELLPGETISISALARNL